MPSFRTMPSDTKRSIGLVRTSTTSTFGCIRSARRLFEAHNAVSIHVAYLVELIIEVLFKGEPFPAKQMRAFRRSEQLTLPWILDTFSYSISPEVVCFLVSGGVAGHVVVIVHQEAEAALHVSVSPSIKEVWTAFVLTNFHNMR